MGQSKVIIQGKSPSNGYIDIVVDNNGNIGSGGGGGTGATITDVGGKLSLDVNVTDITLSSANDSVQVKGPTSNALDPNADGSVGTTWQGFLERILHKAIARLTFTSAGELRVSAAALTTGTNSIGTVGINANQVIAIAGSTTYAGSQMASQQTYQQSFRRNLNVV